MTFWQTTVLGAVAGFTIYLGLPVARLGPRKRTLQNLLKRLRSGCSCSWSRTSSRKRRSRSTARSKPQ
jgi:hypothetical protein